MRAGDTILVILASAQRPFGAGAHVCPGEAIATRIAVTAVRDLLEAGVAPVRLLGGLGYWPSRNARIPRFA